MNTNTSTKPNYSEIEKMVENGELREHHTASRYGYCKKARFLKVENYKGRFGKGYIVVTPFWTSQGKKSTTYECITYYIAI